MRRIPRVVLRSIPIVILLLSFGFLGGWLASRRLVIREELPHATFTTPGDAAPDVRAEILDVLREFQKGYTGRDVTTVDEYVERLFPSGDTLLILGTDPGEWIHGRDRIRRFIATDWTRWGEVSVDVDPASVSTKGDVAWIATTGRVRFSDSTSPIRLTGVLVRNEGRWKFRQVQFQWEKRVAMIRDLLRPRTLMRLSWQ